MRKITDYYLNGILQKSVEKITPEQELKPIGEILIEPVFEDIVYSSNQVEFMKLAIAKLKTGTLNLLFSGLAGTGKTYSSKMIACETKRPFVYMTGSLGKSKIIEMFKALKPKSIILIDEIHNLSEKVAEIIYPAIEYNELYFAGERIILNDPAFIGTTTEPEKLPKPLLDRFTRIEFDEPDKDLLLKILTKRNINRQIINNLIEFTTNIRQINKYLNFMDLYGGFTMENLKKVFKMAKISIITHLSEDQEKYLDYLKKGKASLRNLGLVLRRSENYIKMDIEPDLIKKNLINISSRGRELYDLSS